MPSLEKAGVNFGARQPAVWTFTDNADYSDLGTLVSSPAETRLINEYEAVRARADLR